jgi:hypothetical protein
MFDQVIADIIQATVDEDPAVLRDDVFAVLLPGDYFLGRVALSSSFILTHFAYFL